MGFHVSLELFPLKNISRIETNEKYSYSPEESHVEVSFDIDLRLFHSIYSLTSSPGLCIFKVLVNVLQIKTGFPAPSDGKEREHCCGASVQQPGALCQATGPEKKHECQIRWAHGNQSGCVWTAKHWAECALVPARAVQFRAMLKTHVQSAVM